MDSQLLVLDQRKLNNSMNTNTNESTLQTKQADYGAGKAIFGWAEFTLALYAVTLCIGLVSNLLVVWIVGWKRNFKRVRTVNDIFIMNLALSDLLLIMLFLPFQIYIHVARFEASDFYCKFIASLITVGLGASIFTLTVMALYRWYVIVHPLRRTISHRTVFCWLALVWVVSLALAAPKMVVSSSEAHRCRQHWPSAEYRKLYTATLFALRFVLPLCAITFAYIKIGQDLWRSRAPRFVMNREGLIENITVSKENLEVLKVLAIIVLLFVLCMLPFRIAWLMLLFGNEEQQSTAILFRRYSSILVIFHSCLNPIVYGALTKRFRRACVEHLCVYRTKRLGPPSRLPRAANPHFKTKSVNRQDRVNSRRNGYDKQDFEISSRECVECTIELTSYHTSRTRWKETPV